MDSQAPYQPVNCNFYDLIEHFATLRKKISIQYYSENGSKITEDAVIKTTLNRNKEEFMILASGTEVRMDRIIALDKHFLSDFAPSCDL